MSIHKSLVVSSKLKRHRNVLTRNERIEYLQRQGHWSEDSSVFALPKVASRFKLKKGKGKTKKEKK